METGTLEPRTLKPGTWNFGTRNFGTPTLKGLNVNNRVCNARKKATRTNANPERVEFPEQG